MRDDLLDAQAAVDWAESQIPIVQQAILAWQQTHPYEFAVEDDAKLGKKRVIAIEKTPFPLILNVHTAAVIHALRSSLDLLAAALAQRNGKIPCRNTHFPIFENADKAADLGRGLDSQKCKKWLSDIERDTIKSLKPYGGGDAVIWPMSELDILSKHERIVRAQSNPMGSLLMGHARMNVTGIRSIIRMDQKTILAELPLGDPFMPHKSNTFLCVDIAINEPRLGLNDESVIPLLRKFTIRTREVIALFG